MTQHHSASSGIFFKVTPQYCSRKRIPVYCLGLMQTTLIIILYAIFATRRVLWTLGNIPGFNWGIFSYAALLDHSRARKNNWWLIKSFKCMNHRNAIFLFCLLFFPLTRPRVEKESNLPWKRYLSTNIPKRTDHELMCGSCRYLIAVTVHQ